MRIGILTTVHAPLDTRIYFKQAASLAAAGHQVILVARRGPSGGRRVRRVHLPVPKGRAQRLGLALRAFVAARRLRCDVYHFHDPELLPVGVALKITSGARIVFDVHEHVRMQILDKAWIPGLLRPLVAFLYGALEKVCLLAVDHVVVALETFESYYTQRPVTALRNYPMVQPLLMETPARSSSRASGRWPSLVYCGMVTRIRGALDMLEVVSRLRQDFPQVHLTLIGPVENEALSAEMQEKVAREKLQPHVTLTGRLPIDGAMDVIARADIGLALFLECHNLAQALPTKVFEYMLCKKPVVLSDQGLGVEVVRRERCGCVVPPGDPAAAAQAIRDLLADAAGGSARERMLEMGGNGHRAVLERYSWEAEARRLLVLYDGLCPDKPGRPRGRRHGPAPMPLAAPTAESVDATGAGR